MDFIELLRRAISNPVFDLQLGLALVSLAIAIEAFKTHRHFHGWVNCIAMVLAIGLAVCVCAVKR